MWPSHQDPSNTEAALDQVTLEGFGSSRFSCFPAGSLGFGLNCCSDVRENCWLSGSEVKKINPSDGELNCRRHVSLASGPSRSDAKIKGRGLAI